MIHEKATVLDKVLIAIIVIGLLFGLAIVADYSDKVDALEAEVIQLSEALETAQDDADNWQEKYNDASRELVYGSPYRLHRR